jgi:membrane fusion protein, heavy metal efflux system
MRSKYYIFSLFTVCLVFFVVGCKGGTRTSQNNGESKTTGSIRGGLVKIDERMIQNIKVEEVCETPLSTLLTVTGKVQCNEDKMTHTLAPVSGQIMNLRVKVGDTVKKGDILFYINSREVASAVSDYMGSQKDLDMAEKNHAMIKDLFEHQAASRISLQQAENELAKAKVQVARTKESLLVLGVKVNEKEKDHGLNAFIPIRAPMDGTVIERHLTEGQFVQPDNNPLITIADLTMLWVLADVYERDLHLVKIGQKAEVTTAAYPELCLIANVIHIGDVVDPVSRTVKVRFLVSDSKLGLKPEMFASVSIVLDESTRVITVPEKAVFTESGQNFVYVSTNDNEFSRKQVEITTDGSGQLRIVSGLKSGEKVVSEGALLLSQQEDRI